MANCGLVKSDKRAHFQVADGARAHTHDPDTHRPASLIAADGELESSLLEQVEYRGHRSCHTKEEQRSDEPRLRAKCGQAEAEQRARNEQRLASWVGGRRWRRDRNNSDNRADCASGDHDAESLRANLQNVAGEDGDHDDVGEREYLRRDGQYQ